jgi:hypothetical protein
VLPATVLASFYRSQIYSCVTLPPVIRAGERKLPDDSSGWPMLKIPENLAQSFRQVVRKSSSAVRKTIGKLLRKFREVSGESLKRQGSLEKSQGSFGKSPGNSGRNPANFGKTWEVKK